MIDCSPVPSLIDGSIGVRVGGTAAGVPREAAAAAGGGRGGGGGGGRRGGGGRSCCGSLRHCAAAERELLRRTDGKASR